MTEGGKVVCYKLVVNSAYNIIYGIKLQALNLGSLLFQFHKQSLLAMMNSGCCFDSPSALKIHMYFLRLPGKPVILTLRMQNLKNILGKSSSNGGKVIARSFMRSQESLISFGVGNVSAANWKVCLFDVG